MRNLLVEISAIDPANTGTLAVLRACSANADAAGVTLDGKEWAPVIIGGPEFEFNYWSDGAPTPLDVSYGNVTFLLDAVAGSNVWAKYSYEGANATIWIGTLGDGFPAYRKIWSGKLGPLVRDSDQVAHVPLLGPEADLVRDVLSATYAGTGGVEGNSSLRGTYKPKAIGACTNVAGVLIDPVYWVYQVDGYGACTVAATYENGLALGAPKADAATYAALVALNLVPGEWARCTSQGLFRLGAEPSGKITADIGAATALGTCARTLMLDTGLTSSRITSSVAAANDRSYSIYIADQTSALDVLRDMAFAGGKLLIADGEGRFSFVPMASTKAPGVLNADRAALPLVQPDKITEEPKRLPAYKVRIGHTRVWSVHSISEISPAIAQLSADQAALEAAAEAAQDAAALAAADATLALQYYANMVADGILDRTEKRAVIERFEGYSAERAGLQSQASGQGITTELTAYSNAYNALSTYLTGLSPAYDNTGQDTPIVAANFKAAFINYDVAKQNLLNTLANRAAQTAGWAYVYGAGKPADNATVGATAGTDLKDESGNILPSSAIITAAGVAANVADAALTVAKFATGIRPVEIVGSLPTTGNVTGRVVYLTTDSKVYRWDGFAWTAKVEAVDLTGQIVGTQITDNAISTPKLAAGAITATKIAANTITSDQIAANSLTAGVIAAGAIGTDQLAANAVRADKISANTITGDKLVANTITAGLLASANLITNTAQINDGIITNAKIGNLQVDTLKIAGGAVTANQVVTVADSYCAAGATIDFLTTGWMTIGDGTFGSGIINVNFTIDATVGYDSSCRVALYVDTGAGMVLTTLQSLGITTNNGDSYSRTGGSISTVVSGAQVRVLATMQSGLFIPRSVSRNQYIRDVTMTLMGAKR